MQVDNTLIIIIVTFVVTFALIILAVIIPTAGAGTGTVVVIWPLRAHG